MKNWVPLFQAVIAFVAVLTGLGFVFSLQLKPIQTEITLINKRIDRMDSRIDRMEIRIDRIESKLDQIFLYIKNDKQSTVKTK